jgi:L-ribulose-5-phosphate 3-epimerase
VQHHTKIGIMNGRLLPPIDNHIQCFPVNLWQNEFQLAHDCGFDVIEWIFDLNPNPILHNDGIYEIKSLSKKHDVKISAVCADYFMQKMLFSVGESDLKQNISILKKLIQQCSKLEVQILEIPFVDSSSLKSKTDEEEIIINLQPVVDFANSQNVKIVLETDLAPNNFKNLLEKFGSNIGANYDIGNSASLGYDPTDEIQTLRQWLTNVHIKDRLYAGNTVELGCGNTDFDLVFSTLAKINYAGQLIIQGAREDYKLVDPQDTCKKYLDFVKYYVTKYNLGYFEDRMDKS